MDGCSSSWDMAMGNQCPPHPLPLELLNSMDQDALHQAHNMIPSSSDVFNPMNIPTHGLIILPSPDPPVPLPPPNQYVSHSKFSIQQNIANNIEEGEEELCAMKEMMYKIAVMQPVDIDPATIRKPKRRNVRISEDPQSVAARQRRERISERMRILQRLVPGGIKMDTASMLDEAIRYVKFLKRHVQELQTSQRLPHGATPETGNWQFALPIHHMGSNSSSFGTPEGAGYGNPEMENGNSFSNDHQL